MSWIISGKSDPDFEAYVAAVEAADSATLEVGVRQAYYNFIVGCKADGIWDAIKASCILAGARTLNGALVPLAGSAPTNFNFVAGDYNRKTGLVGNGSTKYLDSNRNNNADPQNSKHLSAYASQPSTASPGGRTYLGTSNTSGSSWLHAAGTTNKLSVRANTSTSVFDLPLSNSLTGFIGVSRNNGANTLYRYSGSEAIAAAASVAPVAENILIYAGVTPGISLTNARLAFYSIGESLDLTKLDSRVTDLITAFGAAIP